MIPPDRSLDSARCGSLHWAHGPRGAREGGNVIRTTAIRVFVVFFMAAILLTTDSCCSKPCNPCNPGYDPHPPRIVHFSIRNNSPHATMPGTWDIGGCQGGIPALRANGGDYDTGLISCTPSSCPGTGMAWGDWENPPGGSWNKSAPSNVEGVEPDEVCRCHIDLP
jgi:hypothetical protein